MHIKIVPHAIVLTSVQTPYQQKTFGVASLTLADSLLRAVGFTSYGTMAGRYVLFHEGREWTADLSPLEDLAKLGYFIRERALSPPPITE